MALQAPIERSTHVALRAAVLDLVESEPRRRFPAALHAGTPRNGLRHVDERPSDFGQRCDIALVLLRGAVAAAPRHMPDPPVWLTRPGELSIHDDDLLWWGPVAWAGAALGRPTGLVVVTRRGWFDPASGVRREWRRLRRRPPA